MKTRLRTLVIASALALAGTTTVSAQSLLPVVNSKSGKVEAFLRLDPIAGDKTASPKWRFGSGSLENAFGLNTGESLALVCDSTSSSQSMRGLSQGDCMLGSLGGNNKRGLGASLIKGGNRVGMNLSKGSKGMPDWLAAGGNPQLQQTDMAMFAERAIGRNGVVSIAGTTANARLVPASEMPILADRWNTQSLSVGGGIGSLRANVFGRVVNVPGQPKFEGFGLGVTWRTPWSGQLSVGAENIVTKGSNPFSMPSKEEDRKDNAVPYVRYQQDL